MFKVGDLVRHKTRKLGKIINYGCRVGDRTYFMTLKVKILKGHYFKPPIEDKMNQWRFVRLNSLQLLQPNLKRPKSLLRTK